MNIEEVAQYGAVGIAILLILFMAYCFKLALDFGKYQIEESRKTQEKLEKAIQSNTQALNSQGRILKNTEATTKETLEFMRSFNGDLRKIFKRKLDGK